MNKQSNENSESAIKKEKPLPSKAQNGQNSIGVSWDFEQAEDADHRLNLIFNLLLNNKLS